MLLVVEAGAADPVATAVAHEAAAEAVSPTTGAAETRATDLKGEVSWDSCFHSSFSTIEKWSCELHTFAAVESSIQFWPYLGP